MGLPGLWNYNSACKDIIIQYARYRNPRVTSTLFKNLPRDEAPAKSVSEKTAALSAEHGRSFAKNAMGSHGVSSSNVTGLAL